MAITLPVLFLITGLLVVLIPIMLNPLRALRWFQLKRYQYEVTFGLYMMTPKEKFVLNSFLFLTFSMILIAASLYLPEHISKITHRAFYYYSGRPDAASFLAGGADEGLEGARAAVVGEF